MWLPSRTLPPSANQDDLGFESIEFLISLGGDGTLLDTVALVRDKNIPVLGINFGRLGFLASIGKEELTTAVTALANRTFVVDKRFADPPGREQAFIRRCTLWSQ